MRVLAWASYFLNGGVGTDPEGNKGYCRRNRLLFMDFDATFYWFRALYGTLDGIKLGIDQ
jgi:hypothetical protein